MLDIIVGLIFVYLLFSLICMAVSEIVAWLLTLRAKTLRSGIEKLLNDPALTDAVYKHPLIRAMSQGQELPSYIPKDVFAAAFLDILQMQAKSGTDAEHRLMAALRQLPEGSSLQRQLYAILDNSVTGIPQVRGRVEKWFNDSMDRVSGWYKRRTQIVVLIVAAVVALVANADSVMLVRNLSRDAALRNAMVEAAEKTVEAGPGQVGLGQAAAEPNVKAAVAQIEDIQKQLDGLRLPMGWVFSQKAMIGNFRDPRGLPVGALEWVAKILGLLFTVLAISLGAPFWFDLLSKIVNVRLAGRKPIPPLVEGGTTPVAPA